MKRTNLALAFFIAGMAVASFPVRGQQGNTAKFYTLQECNNDTASYLKRNYQWKYEVEGGRMKAFLDDANNNLPFKSYWMYTVSSGSLVKILFFLEPAEKIKERVKKNLPIKCVDASVMIFSREERYQEFKDLGFYKILELDDHFYNLVKDVFLDYTYCWEEDEFVHEKIVE
jgi:hypothetical protein